MLHRKAVIARRDRGVCGEYGTLGHQFHGGLETQTPLVHERPDAFQSGEGGMSLVHVDDPGRHAHGLQGLDPADAQQKFLHDSVTSTSFSPRARSGRLAVEAMDGVSTSFVESVAEGQDSERVILNMARKGCSVIFGTSYGYMDPMLKVAKDFPDVKFLHCSGYKNGPNMANYFGRIYQARYLTGMVAASMTAVHDMPEHGPAVNQGQRFARKTGKEGFV